MTLLKFIPFRKMIIIFVCFFLSISFVINGKSISIENLENICIESENTTWPMFHFNAQRTGRCPYAPNLSYSCPELKWKLYVDDGGSVSSPAISKNGTIYLGIIDFHKSMVAINPNGTVKWYYDTGNHVQSSPAIGEDGTIYFGSDGDSLYALYPNGTLKWCTYLGEGWVLSPAIDQNGIIYCTSVVSSQVHAVYPNGTIKWSFQTDGWVYSSPALASDGTVYIGSNDCYLYSINQNGGLNWRYGVGDNIQGTPAIGLDGTIYFGCWDGYLYALYPNGELKWKVSMGNCIEHSSPAIGGDGMICIGTINGRIVSVYPMNGTIKWVFQTGKTVDSSPTIDKNGIIYCGSEDGYLYALNPGGSLRWKYYTGAQIWDSSPVIDADGTIYIATWGSYFHSIQVIENSKPTIPTITGESSGKIKQSYDYTIYSTDPENENISYYVDWDDGTNTGWIGPHPSGQEQTLNHTWNKKGTYSIKAKARDIHDQESDWGTLSVIMPYEPPHFRFIEWLFERFPHGFPILRYLLNC